MTDWMRTGQAIVVNAVKNIGVLREAYRRAAGARLRRTLVGAVRDIPCVTKREFLALQAPLFNRVTVDRLLEPHADALMRHESFETYFRTQRQASGDITFTDHYRGAPFFTRQRMLVTAYAAIGLDRLAGMTLADVGGSNGYYGFLAETMGFRSVDVIDARSIHREQHQFVKRTAAPNSQVRFVEADVGTGRLGGRYDVVLAQGIVYHLYDHHQFLAGLRDSATGFVIVESELCGRNDFYNLCKLEDVSDPRMGTTRVALYPSFPTLIGLLRAVGFSEVQRILPPHDELDLHGYRRGRRTMLLCQR